MDSSVLLPFEKSILSIEPQHVHLICLTVARNRHWNAQNTASKKSFKNHCFSQWFWPNKTIFTTKNCSWFIKY